MARKGFCPIGLAGMGRGCGINKRFISQYDFNKENESIMMNQIEMNTDDDTNKKNQVNDTLNMFSTLNVRTQHTKWKDKDTDHKTEKSNITFKPKAIMLTSTTNQPKYLGKPRSMTTAVNAAKAVLKQLTFLGETQNIAQITETHLMTMSRDDMIATLYGYYKNKGSYVSKVSIGKKSDMILRKDIRGIKATFDNDYNTPKKNTSKNKSNTAEKKPTKPHQKTVLTAKTTDTFIDTESKQVLAQMYMKTLAKKDPQCSQIHIKSLSLEKLRKEMKVLRDTIHALKDIKKKGPIPGKYNDYLKLSAPIEKSIKQKNYYELKVIMLLLHNKKMIHKTETEIDNMKSEEMKYDILEAMKNKNDDDSNSSIKQNTKKKIKIKQEIIDDPKSTTIITSMTSDVIINNMSDNEIRKAIIGYAASTNGNINIGDINKMSPKTLKNEALKIRDFQRSSPLKAQDEFDTEDIEDISVATNKQNQDNVVDMSNSPSSIQKLLNESSPYSIKTSEMDEIQKKHEALQNSKGSLYAVAKDLFPTYATSKIIAEINEKEELANTHDEVTPSNEISKLNENRNNTESQPITQVEFDKESEEEVKSTITKDSDDSNHNKHNSNQSVHHVQPPSSTDDNAKIHEELERDRDGDVKMKDMNAEKNELTTPDENQLEDILESPKQGSPEQKPPPIQEHANDENTPIKDNDKEWTTVEKKK